MNSVAKLMTNILPSYYDFIENEARSKNKSKREIIERAIALYIKESKKKTIMSAYKKMAEDAEYQAEIKESAEFGMEYYLSELEE